MCDRYFALIPVLACVHPLTNIAVWPLKRNASINLAANVTYATAARIKYFMFAPLADDGCGKSANHSS